MHADKYEVAIGLSYDLEYGNRQISYKELTWRPSVAWFYIYHVHNSLLYYDNIASCM